MRRAVAFLLLLSLIVSVASCRKGGGKDEQSSVEDLAAKKMLQGIWVDEDGQDVAFKAQGDTIFYPDSTSQPVYFQIFGDTLVLHGASISKYPIIRQTAHLFIFRNQNGDDVKCVLSDDPDDASFFSQSHPEIISLNQGKLIKRDTVVSYGSERYHCYVQVNPTTFKVASTSYNDDGVAVDNVYYDNIVNLNVYHGSRKLFGGDFRKQQFSGKIPDEFLKQGILSDITFDSIDGKGIRFIASVVIPGSGMSSYQVSIVVGYSGKITISRL